VVEGGGLENRFPVLRNGGSNPSPSAIIAFLRGINVGGHKKIPMAALKAAFEALGFVNVRTVLASGNVVFSAPSGGPDLEEAIARGLAQAFGFPVPVILRTVKQLGAMLVSDPFKAAPSGPDVRLYVTFLPKRAPARPPARLPEPPAGMRIVRVDPGEVYSVVRLSKGVGTPDLLAFLERTVGRDVTTRNWQTVTKLAER
jgi:uncharacterized protein (DUF1697 family)